MSNPFTALDLSDDEDGKITVVKPAPQPKPEKKQQPSSYPKDGKTHQPRRELKKEEENLQQKKRGPPGQRGARANNPDEIHHPGDRAKMGLKEGGDRPPRRESGRGRGDRQSGTGRGREVKKDGAGGHNWGKAVDDAPLPPKTPDIEGEAKDEEPEEDDGTKTLEEYEKEKLAKRSGAAFQLKEARKVDAAPDGDAYRRSANYDAEESYVKLDKSEHNPKNKPGHVKADKKEFMMLDFKVGSSNEAPPRSERGGSRGGRGGSERGGSRGGRGTPRGSDRGGRGGARGGSTAGPRFDPADQSAFPKLGGN